MSDSLGFSDRVVFDFFLETTFGKLDRFMILYKEAESVNNARIWAPVLVLPCIVAGLLFMPRHFTPNIRYVGLISMISVFAFSVFVGYNYSEPSATNHDMSNHFFQVMYTFSPYYPVYPVTQVLLILIAGAGLLGFSPQGMVRFYLSILATVVGLGVAWSQTSLKAAFKETHPYDVIPDDFNVKASFLDHVFLGGICSFCVLFSSCLSKHYNERIRVMHGVVIMYDLFKLWCINDAPAKLVLPHVFGPPFLLAINTIEAIRDQRKAVHSGAFKQTAVPVAAVIAYPQLVSGQNAYLQPAPAYLRV